MEALYICLLHIANLVLGTAMKSISLLLLCLLWSLVEVQSQTEYPYLTFRGNNLPNHSYVDITQVGRDRSGSDTDTIQCRTDLVTCCDNNQEVPRGDWFPPGSDTRLGFFNTGDDIYQSLNLQVVHLRRRKNANGPTGIYYCVIATNAVHDDSDGSVGETVYVGLYTSGGGTWLYVICTCSDKYRLWKRIFISYDLCSTLCIKSSPHVYHIIFLCLIAAACPPTRGVPLGDSWVQDYMKVNSHVPCHILLLPSAYSSTGHISAT